MAKLTKSSRQWLQRQHKDPFVVAARKRGLRSRASIKLEQIQLRDRVIKRGMHVLDLGAAPGGWSQLAAQWVGAAGKVVACDILTVKPIAGVSFIQGDFLCSTVQQKIQSIVGGQLYSVVLSDIAPNFIGVSQADQLRMMQLLTDMYVQLPSFLAIRGDFLVKVFQGVGFEEYLQRLKKDFAQVKVRKPLASRKESKELYLLASAFKGRIKKDDIV